MTAVGMGVKNSRTCGSMHLGSRKGESLIGTSCPLVPYSTAVENLHTYIRYLIPVCRVLLIEANKRSLSLMASGQCGWVAEAAPTQYDCRSLQGASAQHWSSVCGARVAKYESQQASLRSMNWVCPGALLASQWNATRALELLTNKTVVVIGDSMGNALFCALTCALISSGASLSGKKPGCVTHINRRTDRPTRRGLSGNPVPRVTGQWQVRGSCELAVALAWRQAGFSPTAACAVASSPSPTVTVARRCWSNSRKRPLLTSW